MSERRNVPSCSAVQGVRRTKSAARCTPCCQISGIIAEMFATARANAEIMSPFHEPSRILSSRCGRGRRARTVEQVWRRALDPAMPPRPTVVATRPVSHVEDILAGKFPVRIAARAAALPFATSTSILRDRTPPPRIRSEATASISVFRPDVERSLGVFGPVSARANYRRLPRSKIRLPDESEIAAPRRQGCRGQRVGIPLASPLIWITFEVGDRPVAPDRRAFSRSVARASSGRPSTGGTHRRGDRDIPAGGHMVERDQQHDLPRVAPPASSASSRALDPREQCASVTGRRKFRRVAPKPP